MAKQPICLVCWMHRHPGKSTRLVSNPPVKTCAVCGNPTGSGLTEDLDNTARGECPWLLFRLAVLILVLPILIIYLRGLS